MREAFASFYIFSAKNISEYQVLMFEIFKHNVTNVVVRFEQSGPNVQIHTQAFDVSGVFGRHISLKWGQKPNFL